MTPLSATSVGRATEDTTETGPKKGTICFFYIHNPKIDERVYNFYFGIGKLIKKLKQKYKKYQISWKGISNIENKGYKAVDRVSGYMENKEVKIPLPGMIDIGSDTTLIISWSEKPIGILITSKQIADNFRNYFESVWNLTK